MKGPGVRPTSSYNVVPAAFAAGRDSQWFQQQPKHQQKRAAPQAQTAGLEPVIKWLELSFEDPLVAERGLPHVAPALAYSPENGTLLTQANWILEDLIGGSLDDNLELHHDENWTEFVGTGIALQLVGAPEYSFCVAVCPSKELWGVGIAKKWKQREAAAKLALCVALTWNIGDDFDMVASKHVDFASFCEAEGYVRPGGASRTKRRRRLYGGPHIDWGQTEPLSENLIAALERAAQAKPNQAVDGQEESVPTPMDTFGASLGSSSGRMQSKWAKSEPAEEALNSSAPVKHEAGEGDMPAEVPKDVALWMQVPLSSELPPALEHLPREAPVLSTDCTRRKALYSKIDEALKAMNIDTDTEIEYHDDPEWHTFPSIGEELKKLGQAEECMGLAVCLSRAVWAVGVGSKWRSRNMAAKAALVAAIVLQGEEMAEEFDLSEFGGVTAYVDEVRAAKLAMLESAAAAES